MAKRKSGDGLLRKRKDGRWEARIVIGYDENNLPITKNVTSNNKQECINKLEKLKKEYDKPKEILIDKNITFGEWVDYVYQNFRKINLRNSTKKDYEYEIYKYIIPYVGKIKVRELTKTDFEDFYTKLKEHGLSNKVIKGCHIMCRAMLQDAIKEGIIQKNPTENIKTATPKPKKITVLSHEEMQRFLIQAKYEGYFELFLTALMTGMRRGELLALKWSDLNLKTGELQIQRQVKRYNGELQISSPKTDKSNRLIILPMALTKILEEYKKSVDSEWIFPSPVKENSPRDPDAAHKKLQRILKRAGCHKIRFHDLRHTFATMALDGGMDIKTLSDMIGHATSSTTLNVYLHSTDKMKKEAASKIDGIFGINRAIIPKEEIKPTETVFEPTKTKYRKPGTGCIHKIKDNLYEGRISTRIDGKRKSKCVYGKTEEECEKKLQELIKTTQSA